MLWEADVYVLEDCDEMEPPPAKRKVRKTTEHCKMRQGTRWHHVVNMSERKSIVTCILSICNEQITLNSLSDATKQVSVVSKLLKEFCDSIAPSSMSLFTQHLKETMFHAKRNIFTVPTWMAWLLQVLPCIKTQWTRPSPIRSLGSEFCGH